MDSLLACLGAWMPRQRWYAAKGRSPSLRLVGWWDSDVMTFPDGARPRTYLVADEGALPVVLYQVPVVARPTATVTANPDHIMGSPEPGTTLIDGPFDPAYANLVLSMILDGSAGTGPRAHAVGVPTGTTHTATARTSHVLAGEQTNTSIIYTSATGAAPPVILKIYRQLQPGANPDIELVTALSESGSTRVPQAVGSLTGTWPDTATARGVWTGALAFAQEFLPDVEDAWRVALRAAAVGNDFSTDAYALGRATAEVHHDLRELFAVSDLDPDERAKTLSVWLRRLATAVAEVPGIGPERNRIESVYRRAESEAWPAAQRIHGDYHLGQVIFAPDRGWVLLDFEGEPIRPMSERTSPDLALRDVAGMLRSFDYVAGSFRLDDPHHDVEATRSWATAAQQSFLRGYGDASALTIPENDPLLVALVLDKAVYEAIYESRNRPTWVSIPLRAIERILASFAPG